MDKIVRMDIDNHIRFNIMVRNFICRLWQYIFALTTVDREFLEKTKSLILRKGIVVRNYFKRGTGHIKRFLLFAKIKEIYQIVIIYM